ncbi:hypothetical protein [Nocardiopsis coralliicola]
MPPPGAHSPGSAPGAPAASANNRKLFIILGASGGAAVLVVLVLILALGGSPQYTSLVACSAPEDSPATLDGDAPDAPSGLVAAQNLMSNVSAYVDCEGEDGTGDIGLLALLLQPSYAESDGAMESRLDAVIMEVDTDIENGEDHDISAGEHARAVDEADAEDPEDSQSLIAYTTGNLVLACLAEGPGSAEERIDRALQTCAAYEETMKDEASRA